MPFSNAVNITAVLEVAIEGSQKVEAVLTAVRELLEFIRGLLQPANATAAIGQ